MDKNLQEHIKRIKSLFTEERLYGNLISEQAQNPDINLDYKIDQSEFDATGKVITPDEADAFVKKYKTDSGDDYTSLNVDTSSSMGMCMKQPVVKNSANNFPDIQKSGYQFGTDAEGGQCYFYSRKTGSIVPPIKVTEVQFWQSEWITFFVKLKNPIDLSSKTEFEKSFEWDSPGGGNVEVRVKANETIGKSEKIGWLRYMAKINEGVTNYDNVTFNNFYTVNKEPIEITTLEKKIDEKGYKPIVGGSRQDYGNFDGILNELGINANGGNLTDIIDNLKS